MTDLNAGIIIGRLTRDGEFSYTPGGTQVMRCSLANHYSKKVNGEWREAAQFFEFTLWGRRAEALSPYMKKGTRLGVDYQLRQDRWETLEGARRSRIHLHVNSIQLLDGRRSDGHGGGGHPKIALSEFEDPADFDDDILF